MTLLAGTQVAVSCCKFFSAPGSHANAHWLGYEDPGETENSLIRDTPKSGERSVFVENSEFDAVIINGTENGVGF